MVLLNNYPAFPLVSDLNAFHSSGFDRSAYLQSFVSVIPTRLQIVRTRLNLPMVDPWNQNSVGLVLSQASAALQANARATTETPYQIASAVDNIPLEVRDAIVDNLSRQRVSLSDSLNAFCIDCSILFMELLRARIPSLRWGTISSEKNIVRNYPLLLGLGKGWELQPLTFARRDVVKYLDRSEAIDWNKQFVQLESICERDTN